MREPAIPEGYVAAAEELREIGDGEVAHGGADRKVIDIGEPAAAHQAGPRDIDRREDHVFVGRDAPWVAARGGGCEGGEVRRRVECGVPGEAPFVGVADHADAAVGGGEFGGPFDRVVAVSDIGIVVAEIVPVGEIATADVLADEDVAV